MIKFMIFSAIFITNWQNILSRTNTTDCYLEVLLSERGHGGCRGGALPEAGAGEAGAQGGLRVRPDHDNDDNDEKDSDTDMMMTVIVITVLT